MSSSNSTRLRLVVVMYAASSQCRCSVVCRAGDRGVTRWYLNTKATSRNSPKLNWWVSFCHIIIIIVIVVVVVVVVVLTMVYVFSADMSNCHFTFNALITLTSRLTSAAVVHSEQCLITRQNRIQVVDVCCDWWFSTICIETRRLCMIYVYNTIRRYKAAVLQLQIPDYICFYVQLIARTGCGVLTLCGVVTWNVPHGPSYHTLTDRQTDRQTKRQRERERERERESCVSASCWADAVITGREGATCSSTAWETHRTTSHSGPEQTWQGRAQQVPTSRSRHQSLVRQGTSA